MSETRQHFLLSLLLISHLAHIVTPAVFSSRLDQPLLPASIFSSKYCVLNRSPILTLIDAGICHCIWASDLPNEAHISISEMIGLGFERP